MRALCIDEQIRGFIKRVVDYAEEHKIDRATLEGMMAGIIPPIGDNRNYVCYIPRGFRAAYSIEDQPHGWCRHLSVSVDGENKLPNIPAVEMIMKEFGFKGTINDQLHVGIEESCPKSVNVIGEY